MIQTYRKALLDGKPAPSRLFFFPLLLGVLLFSSCAGVSPPPKEDFQITLLEKQIQEMDKKLDEIYHRVSIIQFMIDNHERKLKDLEKSDAPPSADPEVPLLMEEPIANLDPPDILEEQKLPEQRPEPATESPSAEVPPETMYNNALSSYNNADYDQAVSAFNSFADKFPDHDLADNALYWAGECYYARKNYSAAIISFKKVVTRYPEGSKIPDAFLKTGYSYLAMDDKENARLFLKKVITNFPFSPAGAKAEEMLKRIQ
ncbi:MAG: tol-pal system protein YbgF [Pseudomonadota bacterium]